jgi:hypothetical protein
MSNDTTCPRCGATVSEKSLEAGMHECDEGALLERIESLETRVGELEQVLIDAGLIVRK